MSEERRKNVRTQGRFSGGESEYVPRRQDKQSPKMPFTDKNKGEKRKSPIVGSRAQTKIDLQYNDESKYSFKDLETVRKPQELQFPGPFLELSETVNGISRLMYDPNFMKSADANYYFDILLSTTKWHDKNIVVRGVEYPQPRLVAWYGPHPYTYAGATLEAREMPNPVREIKENVEATLRQYHIEVKLNSVLLNLYRNEKDSVAWHSDDELSLGMCPTIASVSLGAIRKFEMRPKENVKSCGAGDIVYVNLTHGSLIVMDGCMQKDWLHRVPKEYHDRKERINLTFRTIYPLDKLPPEMPFVSNMKSAKSTNGEEMHLQDPKFDSESFPPLGMEVSEKKTKLLPKENGKGYQQSVQRKSPKGYLSDKKTKGLPKGNIDKGHQKCVQRKYQEENWDNEMFQNVETPIQNNQKSTFDPIINSPELNTSKIDFNSNIKNSSKECNLQFSPTDFIMNGDYLDSSETYQLQNYEPPNSYLHEPIDPTLPESKFINFDSNGEEFAKLCRNSEFKSDSSKAYQSGKCEPVDSHLFESKDLSPSERKFKIKSEPVEIDTKISDSEKKSMLNANAPDFIPHNKFEKYSLFELAELIHRLKMEEFHPFKDAICKHLDEDHTPLLNRDLFELDAYYELMDEGSLNNEQLKIILKRICSMVKHAYQKLNDPRYMKRYPSRSFSDNYHNRKQSYGRSQKY